MLFDKKLPGALAKLDHLITELQQRAGSYKLQPTTRPRNLWPEEEYGFYIKNEQNQTVLWFGIWMAFWQQTGNPLCFGVDQNWPAPVGEAFRRAYSGQTHQFERWTLGAIPQQLLIADSPVDAIWAQLGPVVDAVTNAGGKT